MSCDQTEATLAWLYGEGDDAHLAHVGGCAACQALVEEHESVLAAVQPAMADISRPASSAGPASTGQVVELSAWRRFGPVLALAAAALLVVSIWSLAPSGSDGPDGLATASVPMVEADPAAALPNPTPAPVADLTLVDEDVDAGLDDLDAEIDDLFADLEIL